MYSENRISSEEVIKRIKDALENPANRIEGSFASDNAQAVGKEIAKYYAYVNWLNDMHYALTATGDWLDKKAMEHGVFRKEATPSFGEVTFFGEAGVDIPTGFNVYSDTQAYEVISGGTIGSGGKVTLPVRSVGVGENTNVPAHAIKRANTVEGLRAIQNEDPIVGGGDVESDALLRERLLLRMRYPGTSGNQYHYMHWAMEVDGVGRVKVFPEWAGPGTVKVSVLDANQGIATKALMEKVKRHIDAGDGNGESLAPIGATLTVSTATAKMINIKATLTGVDESATAKDFTEGYVYFLKEFFKEIAYTKNHVTIAKLIDILWGIDGVGEILSLKVNDAGDNIVIGDEEIPVLGTVELS